MRIFGFDIKRRQNGNVDQSMLSPVSPANPDGSLTVAGSGSVYSSVLTADIVPENENELIRTYRDVARYSDVDMALEDIVNDAIVGDDECVSIDLDKLELSDQVKDSIREEFDKILQLLSFKLEGHDIFRTWYVDGRLFYNILVDLDHQERGIQELRYIDPLKIRKVREVSQQPLQDTGILVTSVVNEYFIYNDKGIQDGQTAAAGTLTGVRLSADSVAYVPSGLVDRQSGIVLSNLQKAVKSSNQLKMIEDSVVIYRITRAPERRVFYIDVGNLPRAAAEDYVQKLMNKYRNKVVYDATTGEVRNDKQFINAQEDFWLPRREGGRGTAIETLNGASNIDQISDLLFFQEKLYRALNVPVSRIKPDDGFNLGRTTEITRDEIKFGKFIDRLRSRFNKLFYDLLKVQLVSKRIIREDEWNEISQGIKIVYAEDNHFTELKEAEMLQERLDMLGTISPYIGKYFSKNWVRKNVLHMTDDEIEQMDNEIKQDQPAPGSLNGVPSDQDSGDFSQEEPTQPKHGILRAVPDNTSSTNKRAVI